jgi:hypothetical protein
VIDATIVIGPCKCGGYGQVFNEESERELGRCHDSSEDLRLQQQLAADLDELLWAVCKFESAVHPQVVQWKQRIVKKYGRWAP